MNLLLAVDYYNILTGKESHMFDKTNEGILHLSNQMLGIGFIVFGFAATFIIVVAAVRMGSGKKENGGVPPKLQIILAIICGIVAPMVVWAVARVFDIGHLFGT